MSFDRATDGIVTLLPSAIAQAVGEELRLPAPFRAIRQCPIAFKAAVRPSFPEKTTTLRHGFPVRQLAAEFFERFARTSVPRADLFPEI